MSRDHSKSRAARRNADRQRRNAEAAALAADPTQAVRGQLRLAHEGRRTAELRHVQSLTTRDPPPSPDVTRLQWLADEQRRLASALDADAEARDEAGNLLRAGSQARKDRAMHLRRAMHHDREAAEARDRQLAQHWEAIGGKPIAPAQAGQLEEAVIETHEFARGSAGEHGEQPLVLDDAGRPVLETTRAKVRRQVCGLDWALRKGQIDAGQHLVGRTAGAIWATAAQAAEPGRGDIIGISAPAYRAPPGPADWRLTAMRLKAEMEASIMNLLPGRDGELVVKACREICYEGKRIPDLDGADRYEAIRLEERLKLGLALIRRWLEAGGERR